MKYYKFLRMFILITVILVYFSFPVMAEDEYSNESLAGYIEKYEDYIDKGGGTKITVEEFFGVKDNNEKETSISEDYLSEYYSRLPEEIKNDLPDLDSNNFSIEAFGISYFLNKISDTASDFFPSYKSSLLSILGILFVSGITGKFSENVSTGIRQALSVVSCTALGVCILDTGLLEIDLIRYFITSVSDISTAVMPVITVLLASTGNLSAASLVGQSLTVVCAVLEFVFSKAVFPLLAAATGLSIVGSAVNSEEGLSLSAFFRRLSTFIIVFSMSFLVFVIAVQSTLSSAADSIGMKTIKFAVGSFIPFVGGAVSDTVNTVSAGFGYIKNTCGAVSLVVLFILLLPPLISLVFSKMVFFIGASVSKLLGCKMETGLFSELSELQNSLIALLVSVTVVFIYIIIFIISCGVKIGGG